MLGHVRYPAFLFESNNWWDSPYINHFLSADTVVQSYANPQSLNRYSYVTNNPMRYTDPTGHMRTDEQCGSTKDQCDHLGTSTGWNGKVVPKNKPKPSAVATMATVLDTIAAGLNGGYAVVGDIVGLVCEACYPAVVGLYQPYSAIPNSVSTLSMILWIGDGVSTGENNFTFSQTSQGINTSLSVSQDTVVAVGTNVAGWTVLRERNAAFYVDAGVAGYDYARMGMIPYTDFAIPAIINPTVTYKTGTGLDVSLHKGR